MVVPVWEPEAGLAAQAALAPEQSVLRAATVVSATVRRVGPVARGAEVLVQTVAPGATAALESDLLPGPRAEPVQLAALGQVKPVLLGAMVRTSVEPVQSAMEPVQSAMESGEA